MREFAFDHAALIPVGRVVFRVHNRGQLEHELYLVGLAPEGPPIAELFGGSASPQLLQPLSFAPTQGPGGTSSFAYDLVPGRYGFVCLVKDTDGGSHARRGMTSEFRTSGGAG